MKPARLKRAMHNQSLLTRESKQNAELAGLKKISDPLGLEIVARLRQIKSLPRRH